MRTSSPPVRAFDRVLLSGFYIVPFYHAANQWDRSQLSDLKRPEHLPRYATPIFGPTLDSRRKETP